MEKRTVFIIWTVIVAATVAVVCVAPAAATDGAAVSGSGSSAAVTGTFDLVYGATGAESADSDDPADPASYSKQVHNSNLSQNQDRQIIISLGEDPGTISISWKGGRNDSRYLRICSDAAALPNGMRVKAKREKLLGGRYYRYTATLHGLTAGRKYYYEIGDGILYDSPRSFTMPKEKIPTGFLYLGDVQFNVTVDEYTEWETMTDEIYSREPQIQFAVIGGDMVNMPREEEQWNGFMKSCGLFGRLPLMTVSGNHEGVRSNKTYRKMFAIPDNGPDIEDLKEDFYYFDFGSCRLIMTDSSFLTDERRQELGNGRWTVCERAIEKWMKRTLDESDKTWNIVVTHHPPYGMHDKATVSPRLRSLWVPIMEGGGVDLVLCGHQHMYMRTEEINGITYIMGNSGNRKSEYFDGTNAPGYCASVYSGANYQIIEADKNSLRIISYNKKGLMIDEAVIKKSLWLHILEFFCGD